MEKRRKYDKVLFYCLHLITRFYREKKKILLINFFCHCLCEHEHEVALVVYVIPRTNSLLSPLNDWSVIMCTHHYTIRVYVWECVTCSVLFFSVAVIVGAVAVVVSGSRVEIVLYGLTNSINGEVVHTQVVLLILYGSNQFSWLLITVALTVWF